MKDDIFLISFKTEGFEQVGGGEENDDGDDGNGGGDFDIEEDDLLEDEDNNGDQGKKKSDPRSAKGGSREASGSSKTNPQEGYSTPKGRKIVKSLINLFADGELDSLNSKFEESVCLNILKAMEIEDSVVDPKEDLDMIIHQDEELSNLLEEWIYTCSDREPEKRTPSLLVVVDSNDQATGENSKTETIEKEEVGTQNNIKDQDDKENKAPAIRKRNHKWGPLILERKSKRQPKGGMSMLERAQALKMKNNL
jgi:hypothetical protein